MNHNLWFVSYCPAPGRLFGIAQICGSECCSCLLRAVVAQVHADLASQGLPVGLLHGNLPQMLRDEATTCFRYGVTSILVCTGMAARGIDVPGTSLVVNVDVPASEADYLHR